MELVQALIAHFEAARKPENSADMERYMRNQFAFLGLKSADRKATAKAFWQIHCLPEGAEQEALIRQLFQAPYRELQYHALDLLERPVKNGPFEKMAFLEELLPQKAWWDTVDVLAPRLMGVLLQRFPEQQVPYSQKWMQKDNRWFKRSAIIFQLKYKAQTNWPLLRANCLRLADEDDFFIRKGIGWALREYSKQDAEQIRQFVAEAPLSKLSKREALRWLKKRS